MKTASKAEIQKLAESLLQPAMEPMRQAMSAEIDALWDRVGDVEAASKAVMSKLIGTATVAALDQLANKVKLTESLVKDLTGVVQDAAESSGQKLADLREEVREIDAHSSRRAHEVRDSLQEIQQQVGKQEQRLVAVEQAQRQTREALERVLSRMEDLENLSVRNHSEALKEVAAGLTEAVAAVARGRVNAE